MTVPTTPASVAEPVALDATADFGNGVLARLTSVEAIDAVAKFPGERSGRGLRIVVEVVNDSAARINLDVLLVEVTAADGTPANLLSDTEDRALAGDLPVGERREGAYELTLDVDGAEQISVGVRFTPDLPTVVFEGPPPHA